MTLSRGVRLPLYFVVLLLLALGINLVRGFDLARRRSLELQPRVVEPVLVLRDAPTETEIPSLSVQDGQLFLLVHLPPRPGNRLLALQQSVGERRLTRWTEGAVSDGEWLVVPLKGLAPGDYGFRWVAPGQNSAGEDANSPSQAEEIHWLGRFTLRRP